LHGSPLTTRDSRRRRCASFEWHTCPSLHPGRSKCPHSLK
jgi:hypothetical protein